MDDYIYMTSKSLSKLCIITAGRWDKGDEYIIKCLRNKNGTVKVLVSDYKNALKAKEERIKFEESLAHVVKYNNLGIAAEKEGRIEDAIQYYETGLISPYPALHSYERLTIIYGKLKQYDDVIRVVDLALHVFSKGDNRGTDISKFIKRKEKAIAKLNQLK